MIVQYHMGGTSSISNVINETKSGLFLDDGINPQYIDGEIKGNSIKG